MCQSLCPPSGPGTEPALSPPAPSRRRHLGAPDAILLMPREGGRRGGFFALEGRRWRVLLPPSIPRCPCKAPGSCSTMEGVIKPSLFTEGTRFEDTERPGRACSSSEVMAVLWGQAEVLSPPRSHQGRAPSQQWRRCHPSVTPLLPVPKTVGISPKFPSELQQTAPQTAEDGQELRRRDKGVKCVAHPETRVVVTWHRHH